MPTATTHPPDDAIAAFALGKLAPAEALPLEEHLAGCDRCLDRAEAAGSDTLLTLLASLGTRADADRSSAPTPTLAFPTTPLPTAPTKAYGDIAPDPIHDADALLNHPKYRLVRRLGIGGMGTVWLAEHAVMNRPVAIKAIRPDLLAKRGAAERFLREVRAAAKLHHPNIVTAFDADPVGDSYLLVMEYVPGETLADRVAAGPLSVAEACRAVRDAARGLAHAHAAGLVHRDVKPHNLIRAADGTVKVLDFGLAGIGVDDGSTERRSVGDGLTGAGVVVGTPDYIAPEQIADPRSADARADVYGLGCTLYHLLAGHPPFPDGSALDKLAAQQRLTPAPIPGLPTSLAAVLAKMMAKRPNDRYRSADAVAAALEPFARAKKRKRDHQWIAVAAGVLLVLAGIAFKIERGNQTIEVRTNDEDVEVVMRRNGEVLRVVDRKTGQVWTIDTTANRIAQADTPEGLTLPLPENGAVVLKRNGKDVFTIARVPKPAAATEPVVVDPLHVLDSPKGEGFGDLDVSSDGQLVVAVGRADKVARVWNVRYGRVVRELLNVQAARFVPGSHRAVVRGGLEQGVRVYNLDGGETLRLGSREFQDLDVSADGRRLLLMVPTVAEVWDLAAERRYCEVPLGPDDVARFTHDGRFVLRQTPGQPMRVYDVLTGQPTEAFGPLRDVPSLGNFTADGRRVLARDGLTATVLDAATGKPIRDFPHALAPFATLTADGRRVVAPHVERDRFGVWDAASGRLEATLKCPVSTANQTVSRASADGRTVAFVMQTGNAYIYRLPDPPGTTSTAAAPIVPRLVRTSEYPSQVRVMAWTLDGTSLVVGGDDIGVLDPATGAPRHRQSLKGFVSSKLSFARTVDRLAVATSENIAIVSLGDNFPGQEIPLRVKSPHCPAVAIAPDGRTVAYPADGRIAFHDLDSGKTTPGGEAGKYVGLRYTADGRFLVAAAGDLVSVLDAKTLRPVDREFVETSGQFVLSGDGKQLVVAGTRHGKPAFYVFGLLEGELNLIHKQTNLSDAVGSLSLAPDGRLLAVGLFDGTVQLWNMGDMLPVATWTPEPTGGGKPHAYSVVAFAPDGRTVATAGGTTVKFWSLVGEPAAAPRTEIAPEQLPEKVGPIRALPPTTRRFDLGDPLSPDGRLVLLPVDRKPDLPDRVRVVEVATGRVVREIGDENGWLAGTMFLPDGRGVLTCVHYPVAGYGFQVWDVGTGTRTELNKVPPTPDRPVGLHASADGRRLAMTLRHPSGVTRSRVVDLETGKELLSIPAPKGKEERLVRTRLSPDGNRAATVTQWRETDRPGDRTELRIDALDGGPAPRPAEYDRYLDFPYFPAGPETVGMIVREPNGRFHTEYHDGRFVTKYWRYLDNEMCRAAFPDPTGRHVAVLMGDDRVAVFDAARGARLFATEPLPTCKSGAISADGRVLAVQTETALRLYRLPDPTVVPKP